MEFLAPITASTWDNGDFGVGILDPEMCNTMTPKSTPFPPGHSTHVHATVGVDKIRMENVSLRNFQSSIAEVATHSLYNTVSRYALLKLESMILLSSFRLVRIGAASESRRLTRFHFQDVQPLVSAYVSNDGQILEGYFLYKTGLLNFNS